jgi:E3 ubiquitin-protein ligase DOA10
MGITPVLSSLLLMVIAVAAMSIAITATYVITDNLHNTMGERFIVEDVWFTTGQISVYLRNVGKVLIKIGAVYVNHTSQSFTPLELEEDKHGWLNVTYSWSSNSVYHVNIVTSRGTKVVDYYTSPS